MSVRLRSVPIAGTAVDEPGNQKLVRIVCAHTRKFGEQKGSFNAYIVFKVCVLLLSPMCTVVTYNVYSCYLQEVESIAKALSANNTIMGKRHLRVDTCTPSLFDPKCSLFLGGLPHYADEEELREHFAKVRKFSMLIYVYVTVFIV